MSDRPYIPRKYRPGDPILAADRNSRNEAIARADRLTGSEGIIVREGASSRQIALDLPECTDIKLTTSANGNGGYGAKEVLPAALGTWMDSGRVMPQGSDPAYERDHNVSLTAGDRVYRACRAATTGEWIFKHSAGGPCTWTITVSGCAGTKSGVTVTIGSTSLVTNGSGQVTFTGLATGSTTATIAAPTARYSGTSATRTLVAGTQSSSAGLPAASGFMCVGSSFGCPDPVPSPLSGTFYLPDGMGGETIIPLTFSIISGFLRTNSFSIDASTLKRLVFGPFGSGSNSGYELSTDGGSTWTFFGASPVVSVASCNPFSITLRDDSLGKWEAFE